MILSAFAGSCFECGDENTSGRTEPHRRRTNRPFPISVVLLTAHEWKQSTNHPKGHRATCLKQSHPDVPFPIYSSAHETALGISTIVNHKYTTACCKLSPVTRTCGATLYSTERRATTGNGSLVVRHLSPVCPQGVRGEPKIYVGTADETHRQLPFAVSGVTPLPTW